ncbi:dienelactone hydrolase family protein [Pseudomonas vanderleydeniana]|uniref:Dienelactone hydrolase family protein n=1 Tax=Pseudomonas vanderleydeniana TaxID=2745495 RepID=A0A9E6TUU0_9PSED|nr:dienelactone hydrolase family protein [Pseudomonas vanderleydeniana]QXI30926.1 dienelactone hydrolase family protein [Pseudomonas vanderleydeniana]
MADIRSRSSLTLLSGIRGVGHPHAVERSESIVGDSRFLCGPVPVGPIFSWQCLLPLPPYKGGFFLERIVGEWIDIAGQGPGGYSGYLALPPRGSGPGLLLIQEIWGVNEHIRSLAEQYAADGFVVLAPDVFWRREYRTELAYDPEGTQAAYLHYQAMDALVARQDLELAIKRLQTLSQVAGRIGVVGYCMGGKLAYELASTQGLSAGVSYYGSNIAETLARNPAMAFPYLFHFAEEDHLITAAQVGELMPLIAATGEVSFELYPGVGHGFACPHRPNYSMEAALAAKASTLSFLCRHLLG